MLNYQERENFFPNRDRFLEKAKMSHNQKRQLHSCYATQLIRQRARPAV